MFSCYMVTNLVVYVVNILFKAAVKGSEIERKTSLFF